jgi:glycosyltransferase involved in cell wall biosynthesis
MKILSLTAGAGRMYCGSCLHDNALAAELKRQGHDVILLPLYTPTRTDEQNVSERRVFFGGISVYLEERFPLFRKLPGFLDVLWDRPSVIASFAGRGVAVDPKLLGELTVSILQGEGGHQFKEIAKLAEWLRHETPPEVVTLPYTLLIALAAPLKKVTGRPVVCSLQGEELFLDGLREPWRSEALRLIRRQVEHVEAFLAVSRYAADSMSSRLGIGRDKIRVVPLGINLNGHSRKAARSGGVFRVGYLGRVAPEKGLRLLAEAYRILRHERGLKNAKLVAAGYLPPEHRPYLKEIEARLKEWRLAGEFEYLGEVDREGKIAFLQSLDVFSCPCTYDEPKGLPVLEAMANGVPVVQPRRGSFPEMIEECRGGLLVDPDSAESLADGIERIWKEPELAESLSKRGYEDVHALRGIAEEARRVVAAYEEILALAG